MLNPHREFLHANNVCCRGGRPRSPAFQNVHKLAGLPCLSPCLPLKLGLQGPACLPVLRGRRPSARWASCWRGAEGLTACGRHRGGPALTVLSGQRAPSITREALRSPSHSAARPALCTQHLSSRGCCRGNSRGDP